MAVITTYQLNRVKLLDLDHARVFADVTGLAGGGFAGIGTVLIPGVDYLVGTIFDSAGSRTDGWIRTGRNGALDQLSNGNIVVATQDADSVRFNIVDSVTGDELVPTVDLGDIDSRNPDVAALRFGGFWIVAEDGMRGGDTDIDVYRRNNDGTLVGNFTVDASAALDIRPCIAALDGGGAAIAWTRFIGSQSEIWYAVFNSAGGTIKAPTLLDTIGTVNRNVDIVATNGGGFALVYEDNGWEFGTIDITMAMLTADGTSSAFYNVSDPDGVGDGSQDANPTVTRLSNGFLAVAHSNNAAASTDTIVTLFAPTGGTRLATRTITGGEPVLDDTENAALAGFGLGRMAVFHTNFTDGDIDGEDLQAQRNSVGDGADDVVVGDDLLDIMWGHGGRDTLSGRGNNDALIGGDNLDTLFGGDGDDFLFGGPGGDSLNGGSGSDTADYWESPVGVYVNLGGGFGISGHAEGDTLVDIEHVRGSRHADMIAGSAASNTLYGDDSNDTIWGASGDDTIDGGGGADRMLGEADDDTYVVDHSSDFIAEASGEGYDTVNTALPSYMLPFDVERVNYTGTGNFVGTGNSGNNRFQSGPGDDRFVDVVGTDIFSGGLGTDIVDYRTSTGGITINLATGVHGGDAAGDTYASIERYWGSSTVGDTMMGNGASNSFYGFGGSDTLSGGGHADRLEGGAGLDTLDGGNDDDILNGGADNDTLTGGLGADQFEYSAVAFGRDTVADFVDGSDKLKVFTGVADSVSDFAIAGNGTARVVLSLAATPANTITLNGAAPITITDADFVFY